MARVNVRSGPSRRPCYLRFLNRTARKVNVIWVDFAGKKINYGTLDPDAHFDIHSYEGHSWICEDSITSTLMFLNRMKVFFPSSNDGNPNVPNRQPRNYLPVLSRNENVENPNDSSLNLRRQHVLITIPVFSLLEVSLATVAKSVETARDINALEIPIRLKDMLYMYLPTSNQVFS